MTKALICIFLGGGTGSVLRYCVQLALHERIVPYNFPWATFTVNIVGSFLIGMFYALSARFNLATAHHRTLRWLHHLFDLQQRQSDFAETRIARPVSAVRCTERSTGSSGSHAGRCTYQQLYPLIASPSRSLWKGLRRGF